MSMGDDHRIDAGDPQRERCTHDTLRPSVSGPSRTPIRSKKAGS